MAVRGGFEPLGKRRDRRRTPGLSSPSAGRIRRAVRQPDPRDPAGDTSGRKPARSLELDEIVRILHDIEPTTPSAHPRCLVPTVAKYCAAEDIPDIDNGFAGPGVRASKLFGFTVVVRAHSSEDRSTGGMRSRWMASDAASSRDSAGSAGS